MIVLRILNRQQVHLVGTIILPLSATAVWGQMRSFTEFVGLDPFHGPIIIANGSRTTTTGTPIILGHRFGPLRLNRIGRILRWREGAGYSFSDLSQRSNRSGFPHIFIYDLRPRTAKSCRLTIRVRGRWTANFLPTLVVRWWLKWVLAHTIHTVRNRLLAVALLRKQNMK